jgi:hypothetical protein
MTKLDVDDLDIAIAVAGPYRSNQGPATGQKLSDQTRDNAIVQLFEAARESVTLAQLAVTAVEEADREELQEHYDDYLHDEGKALEARLKQAHLITCALFETMGLRTLLQDFRAEFAALKSLRDTETIDEGMRFSPAADVLNSYHAVVRATLQDTRASQTRVRMLRRIVQNVEHIVHAYGALPTKEVEVTHRLKEVLSWSFPDAVLNPPIVQVTKTYKPDIGIPADKTAVEVKFVDSDTEGRRVLGEIYTDMQGYAGDQNWASFTAVIYQTAPFLRQDQLDAEARKVVTKKEWKMFVRTGSGQRKKKAGGQANSA